MRRLGVGSASGADRPLRAQLVVALVALLVLVAVPLYLWRRPSEAEPEVPATSASVVAPAMPTVTGDDGGLNERVSLAPAQRIKCSASQRATGQEGNLCDQLRFFEDALSKAIRENTDCAPEGEGTINYVLRVDFKQQSVHVYPGASGKWKGPAARKATKCVKRALPAPPWTSIQHQYQFYQIAILATYRPRQSAGAPAPSGSGLLFE